VPVALPALMPSGTSISTQSQSARHTVLCSHSFSAHLRHATHMHALQTSLLGLSPFTRPSGQIIQADRCTVAGSKVACIKLSQALLGKASICWQMNPTLTEPVHDQLWAAASEDAPHNHQEAYTLLLCFLVHDCDPVVGDRAGGCCANGYTCSRGSQYYWQCIQGTASPSPPPPPVTTPASSPPPPPAATTAPGDTAVRTVSTACCTF